MARPTSDALAARHARLRKGLAAAGLDALIVTHIPNVRYLTGFAGSTAAVVIDAAGLAIVTDGRYATEVASEIVPGCPGLRFVKVDPTYDATIGRVAAQGGGTRIGFEASYLPVRRYEALSAAIAAATGGDGAQRRLIGADRMVESGRLLKDAGEQGIFRRAGGMLDAVVGEVLAGLRAGQRECDIAATIDYALRRGGFERPSFDTIVASGPHSALPHARPTGRALETGDLVVLDFGGVHDGYSVDITRTVSVGAPGAEAFRLYRAVADAHAAAGQAARPGARVTDVDEAARAVLESRGLGEAFSHATGHGLGLEIHEEPRVGPRRADIPGVAPAGRDEPLAEGLVFTIEPGAYVPGIGGVRVEDDVLVTAGGLEWLTGVSRELRVV
jgi:Xaa-Pro aminopeptidase